MPTVYAQVPNGTGVVTCKVAYLNGTSANIRYPVEFTFLDGVQGTVVGRWGPGKDVYCRGPVVEYSPGTKTFTQYVYSISDPYYSAPYEKLYSETGMLDFKVARNGQVHITGKSFVVMDTTWESAPTSEDWLALSAQCTWNLTGSMPAG